MNWLAPNTPAKVARVGISTSATMLTVTDHDRASRMISQPISTTGSDSPSVSSAIWVSSCPVTLTAGVPAP